MKAIKTSVTNSSPEPEVKGKAVKKSGKRIGYNYIILRSLKESQKNDVVKCLYIKSLINFGICVIKEGTYGDSKDKQGRDIKDRLVWQQELHEKLQDKVRLPRLLGSFEENGNYYLVLERIKGRSLFKASRDAGKELREGLITGNKLGMKFLGYMIQMIELLEKLHENGIVHRDVTATNFMITPSGKVAIIDMELSYSLEKQFPDPPFQLGTYGYMSPEQEVTAKPTIAQEVFSVGAIILQIWSGMWPTKLSGGPSKDFEERIRFFIPDNKFAQIIIQSLDPNPDKRPTLASIRNIIIAYKEDRKKIRRRHIESSKTFERKDILDTIQQTILTLSSPLLADNEKGWFSENPNLPNNVDKRKINKAWYASFYKGASGEIYLLSKARSCGMNVDSASSIIEKGLDLIESKYVKRLESVDPSFHFGSSGIAATLATAIRDSLIQPETRYFDWIDSLLEIENSVLGYQYGISGQGIANLLCYPYLHGEKIDKRVKGYANNLLSAQEKDGSWIRSLKDKKNRITKGFAHGVAGIVYFLIEYGSIYNDKEAILGARKGLQWLIKKAISQHGTIKWRSSSDKEIAPWWCEGAAGIGLTFMKAYSLFKEPVYKEYAVGALRNQNKNVLSNNLGQCHGLAGLGEVYLEAFRIFSDEEWLARANWIMQVIMHSKKLHRDHGPFWIVGDERQPVADFMIGNSGIVHFLLRYCHPDIITFPLMPNK